MKRFHIFTIANNLCQYEQMKTSFVKAGFDEKRCTYSLLDNSKTNIYDPYQSFNTFYPKTTEPYFIFCHQDVLMNQGDGWEKLIKVLDELERLDSKWVIAGNAGVNNIYQGVLKITDPKSKPGKALLPQKVHSLDENFLIIKSQALLECSKELKGFHFYATDLCLNAILKGYSCYVIDFHLTHLSLGKLDKNFWEVQANFYKRWNREFIFCYVQTITEVRMGLSRFNFLRNFLSQEKTIELCMAKAKLRKLFSPYTQARISKLIKM